MTTLMFFTVASMRGLGGHAEESAQLLQDGLLCICFQVVALETVRQSSVWSDSWIWFGS